MEVKEEPTQDEGSESERRDGLAVGAEPGGAGLVIGSESIRGERCKGGSGGR